MALKYTHQEMDKDVVFPAGYYTPRKEARLNYQDRQVLYIVGNVAVEASCCGSSSWSYALVPGYIVRWHSETNPAGLAVSDVESVNDDTAKEAIRKMIQETEDVHPVEFW